VADLKLFNNISNNTLVAGQKSTQPVDPSSLPLYFGDTLNLIIYLLQIPTGYNAQDPSNSTLETVTTAGLQLFLYLDDGVVGGTIYTQQVAFATDPTNSYFYGTLALNTPALQTLLGTNTSAPCWLKMGYVQNGVQTTTLSKQVTIGVGIPVGALVVPAGLTPLSQEVAQAEFFPLQPKAGLALYLESPNGKIIAVVAVDNPDGTASLQANPVN